MSMGHSHFNREVGSLNNDTYNNMLQQQMNSLNALNQQNNPYSLGGMGGGGGQNSACTVSCSDVISHRLSSVPQTLPTPKKAHSMFKEIVTDMKAFILEHRSVIYFLAFALIVDHFVFRGAFKARLQGCVDKLVTKVEEKIQ